MKAQKLVSIGCGYMVGYGHGKGHTDLAEKLNIKTAYDFSISDASNDRLIRVIQQHSLTEPTPTFYVFGITFLGRWDLPLNKDLHSNCGRWVSFQNSNSIKDLTNFSISQDEFNNLLVLKTKIEQFSIEDRLLDLALKLRSLVDSLTIRGHDCVIFNTAEDLILPFLSTVKSILDVSQIVKNLEWLSVPYQFDCGVNASIYDKNNDVPAHHKHPNPGEHSVLNSYLVDYINKHYDTN